MKKPLISYALISLSISIIGINACSTASDNLLNLKTPETQPNSKLQANNTNSSNTDNTSNTNVIPGSDTKTVQPSEGVTMVSEEEFNRLKADNNFTVLDEKTLAATQTDEKKSLAEAKTIVDQFLKDNPDRFSFVYGEPSANDSNIKLLDDGNFELKIKNSLGAEQTIITLGQDWKLQTLASAIRNFPTYENQLEIYKKLYDAISPEFKDTVPGSLNTKATTGVNSDFQTAPGTGNSTTDDSSIISDTPVKTDIFPNPSDVTKMKVDEIAQLNIKIVDNWKKFIIIRFPSDKPIGYVSDPSLEVGAGTGNDRTNSFPACTTHKAGGVFTNYNWSNKYYATSVKNQGARGTCVSFGIASAEEMKVAKLNNKWINLSEQDYYYKNKAVWWPSNYGDGLNTFSTWQKLDLINYHMPYENDWDYNPSYSRISNNTTHTYTNSCSGYSEECSDTNHQGKLLCVNLPLIGNICGSYSGANTSNPYNLPGIIQELWNPGNTGLSVALTAINLALGNPVVISLNVTPSFDSPDANGFVRYTGSGESSRGGHALHVTGFIENDALASVLPSAPAGAGGGYFIVKNSWGVCFGDAGYIYLPFEWVKKYTYSMLVRN